MKEKVIIIPGNPSAESIYKNWIKLLKKDFPDYEYELLLLPKLSNRYQNLHHVISYYEEKIKKETHSPIVIGHSIGGFFASQIFQNDIEKIKKLILIFPYFGDENIKGKTLLKLAEFLTKKTARINFISKVKPILDKYYHPSSLVTKEELEDSLHLAKLEKDYFRNTRKNELNFLSNKKIQFIYTHRDNWCTAKTVKRMMRSQPHNPPHYIDTIHDFVVSKEEINKVHVFLRDKLILK